MRHLLVGLFIGLMTLSASAPRAAIAQDMQMKKCAKCGQTSITAQSKCLVCGTPYGTSAPKPKAKEPPAKKKEAPPQTKPSPPAKAKEKPAPTKRAAKVATPAKTSPAVARSKAKPTVVTKPVGKPAPVVKAPKAATASVVRLAPTVTVELPANPYETGLIEIPIKAVARNAPKLSTVEIKYSVAGKEAKLPNRRTAGVVKLPITAVAEGVLNLGKPNTDYRVWAVAHEGAMTITSEPVVVKRNPQTLPKLAMNGAFEAFAIEDDKQRLLDAADPALSVGKHLLQFFVPNHAKPTMVSKPVEVQVGASGRLSSAVSQVALDSVNGAVNVTVMRQGAPVNAASVRLASVADPQRSFTVDNGADGLYKFAEVPVGKYRLTVNQKPRQEVDVAGGSQPVGVNVNLAPPTLAVRAQLESGDEITGIEFQSVDKAGRPLLLSSKAQAVEPGAYTLSLNAKDANLWALASSARPMVSVNDEQDMQHKVSLRRRQGAFVVKVADNEPAPNSIISLKPGDAGWPGAQARSLAVTTTAQGQLQVGDYEVVFAESEKDEWEPATVQVQAGKPGEVTLRRRLGPLALATEAKSDSASFNEKDLRFDLRKPDGAVRSVSSGTLMLPRGSYEVSVDPKTVPKGWRVAAAGATKVARVPVDSRVLFTLEPNSASLTLQKLLRKKRFLVQVDNEKAQLLDADDRGEIHVAMTPGVHAIHVASLEYEFLDFIKKVQAPDQTTLAVLFSADEGEVSIARGEPQPPRRARIEVTLDLPADEAWARYVKDRGGVLPKKMEASYSRDGRLLLPANLALPPAPYRATITWSEESNVVKTETGVGGKQDLKFDIAKRTLAAKGEIVWRKTK